MKKVEIALNELLHQYNLSLNQLHLLTGIRRAALSELANGKRQRIQLDHIEKIANALDINDINKIITIKDENKEY
ncbi:helix-turn-helix domain-containing protein [Gracilibacillus salitolerans]|uniref:Helix-turn-helix domain-containing protein n=1 Tax=Gracilibacillus salitolerans TaxID=2663022 RepID=A0A5Q2TMR6_9BACI|nr:helix-turn-helix transcriptional regulator [Gracilibacillus salitolerans]QGH36249.1 helix-turn-helix domain-containing protein [Gracilibacillus salitolerans]